MEIPGGALAADTEISLTVQPAANGTASSVYEFGPDGLQFETPAALSIAFDGEVPEGKEAVLAVEEGGQWTALPGSSFAGGKVSAPVSHFSRFAIILRDGQAVAVSECSEVVDGFSPCGGDVVGTWRMVEFCFTRSPIGDDPFEGRCPDARIGFDIETDGTIEFTADTVTVNQGPMVTTIDFHVPLSCLPMGARCSQIFQQGDCNQTADACERTQTQQREAPEPETNAYRIEGQERDATLVDPRAGR